MAGLKHFKMAMDPALVKLNNMTTNRHMYFRWTPRTARITFMYMVAIPTFFGVLAYSTDGKFDFRGKRRGDSVLEY